MSAESYRSVILTLIEGQKDRIKLKFLDFETHFPAKRQIGLSYQGLPRIVFTRDELFS